MVQAQGILPGVGALAENGRARICVDSCCMGQMRLQTKQTVLSYAKEMEAK